MSQWGRKWMAVALGLNNMKKRQERDRKETEKDTEDLTLPAQAWIACPDASLCPQQIGKYWPQFV